MCSVDHLATIEGNRGSVVDTGLVRWLVSRHSHDVQLTAALPFRCVQAQSRVTGKNTNCVMYVIRTTSFEMRSYIGISNFSACMSTARQIQENPKETKKRVNLLPRELRKHVSGLVQSAFNSFRRDTVPFLPSPFWAGNNVPPNTWKRSAEQNPSKLWKFKCKSFQKIKNCPISSSELWDRALWIWHFEGVFDPCVCTHFDPFQTFEHGFSNSSFSEFRRDFSVILSLLERQGRCLYKNR